MDKILKHMIEEAIARTYEEWGRENNKSQARRKGKIIAKNMTEAYLAEQKKTRSIFGDMSCDDISLKEESTGC